MKMYLISIKDSNLICRHYGFRISHRLYNGPCIVVVDDAVVVAVDIVVAIVGIFSLLFSRTRTVDHVDLIIL